MSTGSRKLNETFGVKLSPELVSWFDEGIYEHMSGSEFSEFFPPGQLVEPGSGVFWGGQMLPDTIPVCGNGCGDVLCLRIDTHGDISEVLHWNHEGGQWSPWGKTFSQAILWDLAKTVTETEFSPDEVFEESERILSWALGWAVKDERLRATLAEALRYGETGIFKRIFDAGLSETAASAHFCTQSLRHPLQEKVESEGGGPLAERLGIDWNDFAQWLIDPALIPGKYKKSLAQYAGVRIEDLDKIDRHGALAWASRAAEKRPDLAWPFAVKGKCDLTKGDIKSAAQCFVSEMKALMTTYDFTGGWFAQPFPHRERFERLKEHIIEDKAKDDGIVEFITMKVNLETRDYWIPKAKAAEKNKDYPHAFKYWYAAGWDEFYTGDMEIILDGLTRSAQAAGYEALLKISKFHQENLQT